MTNHEDSEKTGECNEVSGTSYTSGGDARYTLADIKWSGTAHFTKITVLAADGTTTDYPVVDGCVVGGPWDGVRLSSAPNTVDDKTVSSVTLDARNRSTPGEDP